MKGRQSARHDPGSAAGRAATSAAATTQAQLELARQVRGTHLLDPALKRHWLRILPSLLPADRRRLSQILAAASALDATVSAPETLQNGRRNPRSGGG